MDKGQQANVLDKLNGLFEWAKAEPRVGGFVGWHYRNRTGNMAPGCPCDMRLGAEAMPAVVRKLTEIGRYIGNLTLKTDDTKDCNVLAFGAKGDNATEDTVAVQAAINACAGAAAGAVVLPAGHVFLTMPLTLLSHTTLIVAKGATLLASPEINRWPNSTHGVTCHTTPYEAKNPVYVPQLENYIWVGNTTGVTITGGGVIDGQGWRWWPLRKRPGDYWHNCRPKLVAGDSIGQFTMHNITLRDSPMYLIRPACAPYNPSIDLCCGPFLIGSHTPE